MNLNGVQIRGRLSFNGATITNTTAGGKAVVALSAVGARIAGTLRFARFGPTTTTEPGGARLHCEGRINLAGAEVGGDLLFQGASLRNGTEDAIALSAKGIHVGGNVSFTSGFSAEGAVMMPGATVGRGVRFSEARFRNRAETAIHAKDMRIGDDLCFENTAAEGDLRFERIDVAGSLVWDGLAISSTRKQKPNPPLDLRHARIGSALKARELSVEHPSLIDLYGMRVSSIELSWPKGWGSPKADHRARLVNLDGLTYDRITISSAREKASASLLVRLGDLLARVFGPRRNSLANDYARWLRLQAKQTAGDGSGFLPQPYRQLARVLRNQGEDGAARDIAIAEQWAAPKAGLLPGMARSAFGIGFGFGLRPRNAIITLLVFLLVGTAACGPRRTVGS